MVWIDKSLLPWMIFVTQSTGWLSNQLKPMVLYKLLCFWYPRRECFAEQQECNTKCKLQAFPNLLSYSSYSPFCEQKFLNVSLELKGSYTMSGPNSQFSVMAGFWRTTCILLSIFFQIPPLRQLYMCTLYRL